MQHWLIHRSFSLAPSSDHKALGFFLYRLTRTSFPLRVKFALTIVNQEDPANCTEHGENSIHLSCCICILYSVGCLGAKIEQ